MTDLKPLYRVSVTLTALAAALVLSGCGEDSAAAGSRPERPPAIVEVAPVQQGSFDAAVRFVARLEARSSAELTARTDGPITAVYAGSGDRVRKGQLLAQIDAAEAQQAVNQAEAALRMAQATVSQRQSALTLARSNAARSQKLFSENLLSQSDLDVVEGELSTASSQLELARAQVEQARSSLNTARLRLEQTRVVAPFDGHIGTRHLDLGAISHERRRVGTHDARLVVLARHRIAGECEQGDGKHAGIQRR